MPVYNGLTDEWHPTQMLADILTMREHTDKPRHEITYAFLGDARNNMGNSLLVMGAIMGMDVRICGAEGAWPRRGGQRSRAGTQTRSGARSRSPTISMQAVKGVDFVHTDVWVSMGEAKEVWEERIKLLKPYQVNKALMQKTGNPSVKFMHCLPAFHDTETKIGKEIAEKFGIDRMEVTEEVFESPSATSPSSRPKTACTRSRRSWSPPWGTEPCGSSSPSAAMRCCKRGEAMTAENQRAQRQARGRGAGAALPGARAGDHPRQRPAGRAARAAGAAYEGEDYPLDVLGAETDGMIGYMIEQELGNLLPFEKPFATLLTMVEVDPHDPGLPRPDQIHRPGLHGRGGRNEAADKGWQVKPDGKQWRRVVPSPLPKRIFQLRPIKWLLDKGTVVIAAGGGGIPTMYEPGKERHLVGVECVIDKDRASALLAKEIGADFFVVATDADAVYLDWGKPEQRAIRSATPDSLDQFEFPAGSMGPKVEAAQDFARATGKRAVICALPDVPAAVRGEKGTTVDMAAGEMRFG